MKPEEIRILHGTLVIGYTKSLDALEALERCWALYEHGLRSGEGISLASLRTALGGDPATR